MSGPTRHHGAGGCLYKHLTGAHGSSSPWRSRFPPAATRSFGAFVASALKGAHIKTPSPSSGRPQSHCHAACHCSIGTLPKQHVNISAANPLGGRLSTSRPFNPLMQVIIAAQSLSCAASALSCLLWSEQLSQAHVYKRATVSLHCFDVTCRPTCDCNSQIDWGFSIQCQPLLHEVLGFGCPTHTSATLGCMSRCTHCSF